MTIKKNQIEDYISDSTQTELDWKLDSVVWWTNITIDNTDPNNPVINWSSAPVDSVNGKTWAVVLDTSDVADTTDARYVTDAEQVVIWNTSWTNTWDQTNVTWNSGTTDALNSATTEVNVSSATAPTTWQVLTAIDSSNAEWQSVWSWDYTLISSQNPSAVSSVTFSWLDWTYKSYRIIWNLKASTNWTRMQLAISQDWGSTFISWATTSIRKIQWSSSVSWFWTTGVTDMDVTWTWTSINADINFTIDIIRPLSHTPYGKVNTTFFDSWFTSIWESIAVIWPATSTVTNWDAIRIKLSAWNIADGEIALYWIS